MIYTKLPFVCNNSFYHLDYNKARNLLDRIDDCPLWKKEMNFISIIIN